MVRFTRSQINGLTIPRARSVCWRTDGAHAVRNRFGLRPAKMPDGSPTPLRIFAELDRAALLEGVTAFTLHPHLPHFERLGDSVGKLDVLARQPIDPGAAPHPFTAGGRLDFDALLQSKPDLFLGGLLICDVTTWTSTWGGVDSLQRFRFCADKFENASAGSAASQTTGIRPPNASNSCTVSCRRCDCARTRPMRAC